ncbi:hypothetical protein GMLC_01610 [Geomonas limicola]|uniref:Porin n=1 Tax=Geomonas limicola TaxID=2740186 RepID=A0A6V8N270_9BACT|nr:hypothetical protein GMLC_01610 [Geomonas limicola]
MLAADPPSDAASPVYHTPLAGEAGSTNFHGYSIALPATDRAHQTALTLGGTLLLPRQGRTTGVPIAAGYFRHYWEDSRTRDVVSIFVNDLEYDRRIVGPLEVVGRLENYTLPGTQTELAENREVTASTVSYGSASFSLGPGVRLPVAPLEVDNDLKVQLLGTVGYFYAARSHETNPELLLPPNTLSYGTKLRVRYDALRRNLLELPHYGFAAGCDADYQVRAEWQELGTRLNPGPVNRDYLQVSGYLFAAGPVPGLSEKNRLVASAYGGTTYHNRGDRFNAYRLNGGPLSGEAEDIARPHYTGMVYDDILVSNYAILSAGYRRELCFFIYLTLAGTYLWADRANALDDGRVQFRETTSVAGTASLDLAFFGNSSFNLGYVWDSGAVRNGRSGSGVSFTWNKLF